MSKSEVFIAVLAVVTLVIIAVIPKGVQAADVWLDLHVASRHAQPGDYMDGVYKAFNENNEGIGLSIAVHEYVDVSVGAYDNSYYKRSNYAGVDVHTAVSNYVRLGVSAGYVSGYEFTNVMVLPNVTFIANRFKARIGVIPGDKGVVTFSVGVRL